MSYAISGGNQKTIEAAEIILSQGGNAVDAAIAAYLVSFISEPCMASIGASGFAMINDTKRIKMVDFFCQTPKVKKRTSDLDFIPITVDFGNLKEDYHVGKGSIAVPGAVAGIFKMHEIWGKLPIPEIFEPALQWSKEGIKVDKFQAHFFQLLENIFKLTPEGEKLFFNADGSLKIEGQIVKMPEFHDFLDVLKIEGKDLIYKGEVAKQVSEDLKDGGHLNRNDFEEYEVYVKDPITFDFFDYKISTPGFPSVGGMLNTALLNTFQDLAIKEKFPFLSLSHFQQLVNTFTSVKKLQNNPRKIANYLNSHFGINTDIRQKIGGRKWGGTSHFNVIDNDGMTVCLTTSVGEGSGYFIKGTNMQMNNMLGEEALMPDGFHNWKTDVRLQSMMSPSIVSGNNGQTLLGIGSGGAGRIPYAIGQAIINILYYGLDPLEAIAAPRIHLQDSIIEMESGYDINTDLFENLNEWKSKSLFFGGTNLIYANKKQIRGIADPRRYGAVIESNS